MVRGLQLAALVLIVINSNTGLSEGSVNSISSPVISVIKGTPPFHPGERVSIMCTITVAEEQRNKVVTEWSGLPYGVRAGAFIPSTDAIQKTITYSSEITFDVTYGFNSTCTVKIMGVVSRSGAYEVEVKDMRIVPDKRPPFEVNKAVTLVCSVARKGAPLTGRNYLTWISRVVSSRTTVNNFRTQFPTGYTRYESHLTFRPLDSDNNVTLRCNEHFGGSGHTTFKISVIIPPDPPKISGPMCVAQNNVGKWSCSSEASYKVPDVVIEKDRMRNYGFSQTQVTRNDNYGNIFYTISSKQDAKPTKDHHTLRCNVTHKTNDGDYLDKQTLTYPVWISTDRPRIRKWDQQAPTGVTKVTLVCCVTRGERARAGHSPITWLVQGQARQGVTRVTYTQSRQMTYESRLAIILQPGEREVAACNVDLQGYGGDTSQAVVAPALPWTTPAPRPTTPAANVYLQEWFIIGMLLNVTCAAGTVGEDPWPGELGDIITAITLKGVNDKTNTWDNIAKYSAYTYNVTHNRTIARKDAGWKYEMVGGQDHPTLHRLRGNVRTMRMSLIKSKPSCIDAETFRCAFDYYDKRNRFHGNEFVVSISLTGISPITDLQLVKHPLGELHDSYALINEEVTFSCTFNGPTSSVYQWSRKECPVDETGTSAWSNVTQALITLPTSSEGSAECTEDSYPYRKYSSSYTFHVSREVCGLKCAVNSSAQFKEVTVAITPETEAERVERLKDSASGTPPWFIVVLVVCGIIIAISFLCLACLFREKRRKEKQKRDKVRYSFQRNASIAVNFRQSVGGASLSEFFGIGDQYRNYSISSPSSSSPPSRGSLASSSRSVRFQGSSSSQSPRSTQSAGSVQSWRNEK